MSERPLDWRSQEPTISFRCPHCKEELEVPTSTKGQKAKCVACGRIVGIPRIQLHWSAALAALPIVILIGGAVAYALWFASPPVGVVAGIGLAVGLFWLVLQFGNHRWGAEGFSWVTCVLLMILFFPLAIIYAIVATRESGGGATCRYCAERIQAAAIRCKHCGADLVG